MVQLSKSMIGLLALIAVYVLGGWFFAQIIGAGENFTFLLYSRAVVKTTLMLLALFVGWRFVLLVKRQRPQRPTIALLCDLRECLFRRDKIAQALPIFIAFMFFMSAFTSLKALIPAVQPYVWDESFAAWDRLLHLGVDPWRILQPILGYPLITSFLNVVYNLWFPVMFAVLYWQLFDLRRPALRMRFFWTFFLTWMLNGTVLAMLLSSAGPCFYGLIVSGDNPYAGQMTYLQSLAADYPVWAVSTQQMLWQNYQNNAMIVGSGISAMPSVHVAMVTLFSLLAWQYDRAAKWFYTLFAIIIFLGSVHLAWHYAIDGYVGAAVTAAIWWMTGRFYREGKSA